MWQLNLACVESENRFDICQKKHKTKKIKDVPSQLNLNLTNPQFNIPPLPEGMTNEQILSAIQQVMKPALDQAANSAVLNLIAALPDKGYQHADYDAGWRKIDGN